MICVVLTTDKTGKDSSKIVYDCKNKPEENPKFKSFSEMISWIKANGYTYGKDIFIKEMEVCSE